MAGSSAGHNKLLKVEISEKQVLDQGIAQIRGLSTTSPANPFVDCAFSRDQTLSTMHSLEALQARRGEFQRAIR